MNCMKVWKKWNSINKLNEKCVTSALLMALVGWRNVCIMISEQFQTKITYIIDFTKQY